jgi:hypothetical protein
MAHRHCTVRDHRRTTVWLAEPVEQRTLLTFDFVGSAGNDLMEVQYNSSQSEYRFTLNGSPAGTTQDTDVHISALGGNDTVKLYHVADATSITVFGGSGDDDVEVGNGRLASNLQGEVFLLESSGNDELIANDSLDNAAPDRPVRFQVSLLGGLTHALYPDSDGSVHFDQLVNTISLLSSEAADTVYLDAAPEGVQLFLQEGNDKVIYGGTGHVVPALQPATILGGAGFDEIIIDDSNGPAGEGRTYLADDTHILNQRLTDVENLTLNTRPVTFSGQNQVQFTGLPVGDNITVRSAAKQDRVEIGPIDLDDLDLIFTNDAGVAYVRDDDANASRAPFELWVDGSTSVQRVDKGGFRGLFHESAYAESIVVEAGPTGDLFEISKVQPRFGIIVRGGAGSDVVQPGNRNGIQADIDAIFAYYGTPGRGTFSFDGQQGSDALYLDDQADQLNDNDHNYFLGISGANGFANLAKGVDPPPSIGFGLVEWDNLESVNLIGDNDNNTFYFDSLGGVRLVVHGAAGNDTFTNLNPHVGNGSLVEAADGGGLIGGEGIDAATLDDSRDQLVDEYALDVTNGITYRSGGTTRAFFIDSLMENVSLDQNDRAATSTVLRSKRPTQRLSLTGRGGDDTFIVGGGDIDASGVSSSTTTLLGGTGNDRIEFDDRQDDHNVSDADTFTFEFQRVTKDGVAIIYAGFESQKLYTSGVNNSSLLFPNTVRMHGIDMPTEVVGTAGDRDNTVDLGHPTFGVSQVTFGTITLDFAAAPAVVNVNDQVATAARTFQLTATQLLLPSVVNYSGVAGINIFAGSGNDTFNVDAVAATTNAFFAGNNGNELMSLGSGGPFAALAGRVYVRGNAGSDELFITNGLGGGFTDATLTNGSFTANGGPAHLYDTAESIHVIVNDAGSEIDVPSLGAPTTIHGGAGADRVSAGAGDLFNSAIGSLWVEGGAGQDAIDINDADSTDPFGGYAFDVDGAVERFIRSSISGSSVVFSVGVEQRTAIGNNVSTGFRVYDTLGALRIVANGGHDGIVVDAAALPVTVSSGAGLDFLKVGNQFGAATPTVVFEQDDELAGMSIWKGTVRVQSGAVLCNLGTSRDAIGEPVIGGTLDLAGGAYLGRPGQYALPADAIRGLLTRGRNGGAWNGTNLQGAINSSLAASSPARDAVGYGVGAQVAPASIGSFNIAPDDVLVRYTLEGDANLDQRVNLADFNRLAAAFGTGSVWTQGDFDYDNDVDLPDFNALAGQFGAVVSAEEGGPSHPGGPQVGIDPQRTSGFLDELLS